jgi:hypothetical protein
MAYSQIQGSDWLAQLNSNFSVIENAELIELASDAETITGTDATKGVTPAGLQAKVASATAKGIAELATSAETITGTDTARVVTPAGLKATLDARMISGKHTATAGEATAETLEIATGLAGATGFIVQIFRSGVMVMADAAVSILAGALTVANGAATYDVTEGDVINWIVF